MVSDASKKREAQKKAAAAAKREIQLSDRTCTGALGSHPLSRDIRIESLSLTFHGHDPYRCRELPIPDHMGIFHLTRGIEASDMSSLQAVVSCDEERLRLEIEVEVFAAQDDGGGEQLERIYERLEALDASTAKKHFLNGVCTNIIHIQNKKLKLYTGNYDQHEQITSMKEYIACFGHGSAKLARQAQSKEKTLAKMERGGLTEKVVKDKVLVFRFSDVGKLPPPVLQFVEVTFGYTPDNLIYKNLDFGVDLDSRVALGPNGAGKSTLLKLMTGDLVPLDGMYRGNEEEKMRASIGRFGLTGKAQVMPMKNLSDGQRSRLIFAWLAFRQPHMLLQLTHLPEALNEWDCGMVLVCHDFRLVNQVAHEIWVCENQTVTRWEGDIMDFKLHLKARAGIVD
ncbi:unnamed protein product [Withania somnifera]